MAGVGHGSRTYKPLRPSQIIKSEKRVQSVMRVITEDFINPFNEDIADKDKLYNLSSGVPIEDDDSIKMLQIPTKGTELYEEFRTQRIITKNVDFHTPITRNKFTSFKSLRKVIKTNTKSSNVQVNRNIIASLSAFSIKHNKVVDMENALKYPLSSIRASIANVDGAKRETSKSALAKIIFEQVSTKEVVLPAKQTVIVDFIAQIRIMKTIYRG